MPRIHRPVCTLSAGAVVRRRRSRAKLVTFGLGCNERASGLLGFELRPAGVEAGDFGAGGVEGGVAGLEGAGASVAMAGSSADRCRCTA